MYKVYPARSARIAIIEIRYCGRRAWLEREAFTYAHQHLLDPTCAQRSGKHRIGLLPDKLTFGFVSHRFAFSVSSNSA